MTNSAAADEVAERSPKLVEELVPDKMSLSIITVLQNLLAEGISVKILISNRCSIFRGWKISDPDQLTALVNLD